MHHITLTFPQFIILVSFIYIFCYYWTPKPRHTDEYLKLLDKYNKVSDKLERRIQKSILHNEMDLEQTTIGKSTSAHSSGIKPIGIHQNDNDIVYQITH